MSRSNAVFPIEMGCRLTQPLIVLFLAAIGLVLGGQGSKADFVKGVGGGIIELGNYYLTPFSVECTDRDTTRSVSIDWEIDPFSMVIAFDDVIAYRLNSDDSSLSFIFYARMSMENPRDPRLPLLVPDVIERTIYRGRSQLWYLTINKKSAEFGPRPLLLGTDR